MSTSAPREGINTDALAQHRLPLLVRAARNPCADSLPDPVLVGGVKPVNVLNQVAERVFVVRGPVDGQVQRPAGEGVGLLSRHGLARAGRVLSPPRTMAVVADRCGNV